MPRQTTLHCPSSPFPVSKTLRDSSPLPVCLCLRRKPARPAPPKPAETPAQQLQSMQVYAQDYSSPTKKRKTERGDSRYVNTPNPRTPPLRPSHQTPHTVPGGTVFAAKRDCPTSARPHQHGHEAPAGHRGRERLAADPDPGDDRHSRLCGETHQPHPTPYIPNPTPRTPLMHNQLPTRRANTSRATEPAGEKRGVARPC
jgi:hypothetical protein